MQKRGQITVFIIIGIIMLFLTAGFLFIFKSMNNSELKTEQEVMLNSYDLGSVRMYIDHCFERTSREAIIYVGLRGGYYKVPPPSNDQIFIQIPYYLDLGNVRFPSKERIAEEVKLFIEERLDNCLNNFTTFRNSGYDFEEGEISAKVILENAVVFELDYPLIVKKGKSLTELRKYSYRLPLNFQDIYSTINRTVNEQAKIYNYVPIGEVSALSFERNFTFDLSYLEDDVVVYSYIFDKHFIDRQNYVFVFANRYNWSHLSFSNQLNYSQEIEDQYCYVGDVCQYNLNIYQKQLRFEDYTNLFNIFLNGLIRFTPRYKDVGKHNIFIKVGDNQGNEKFVSFNLEIVSLEKVPVIKPIEHQIAYVNKTFNYSVYLEEEIEDIIFTDDSDLFKIDNGGKIGFVPQNESVGFHIIEISTSNGDLTDTEWMYLIIENEE